MAAMLIKVNDHGESHEMGRLKSNFLNENEEDDRKEPPKDESALSGCKIIVKPPFFTHFVAIR
jgi:hypothetical protein